MKVLLDTNALMMPVECNVRVFDELERLLGPVEPSVPKASVDELKALSSGAGQESMAASVGLDLLERCTVRSHEATKADDAVIELAGAFEYVVTNDAALRRRLADRGVPVIGLRQGSKLGIYDRSGPVEPDGGAMDGPIADHRNLE